MRGKIKTVFLTLAIIFSAVFFIAKNSFAMPVGTLLYRTSGGGQMYGYNTNELLDGLKVNCGHVGIYVGKNKEGDDFILEAVNNGVQLTPAKYFINTAKGEKLVGAKIPKDYKNDYSVKIEKIVDFFNRNHFGYDFDFKYQKGPDSEQWICVGLTEKIYESLGFQDDKFNYISQFEYNPDKYAIDITKDGYDDESLYNEKVKDYFSKNQEFSQISKRWFLAEGIGYGLGKINENKRYFFFPYTQFLQESLKDVLVDIELESDFNDEEIRGKAPYAKIVGKMFINNGGSSSKIVGDKTKEIFLATKDFFKRKFNNKQEEKYLAQNGSGAVLPAEEERGGFLKQISINDLFNASEALSSAKDEAEEVAGAVEEKIIETASQGVESAGEAIAKIIPKTIKKEISKLGISYVIDGDTIILSSGEKVRYLGIDTPELGEAGESDDECLAWFARLRNMELLKSGKLELIKDEKADKDKYGRLLRYVYLDGKFINEILVREGLAEVSLCDFDSSACPILADEARVNEIIKAGKEAEKEKLGLFSDVCQIKNEISKTIGIITDKVDFTKDNSILENKEMINDLLLNIVNPFSFGGRGDGDVALNTEENFNEEELNEEATSTDEEATTTEPNLLKIVISEFSARGSGGAGDEFVELYNIGGEEVDLSGWKLQYKSAPNGEWKNKTGTDGISLIIGAKSYLLFVGKGYASEVESDYQHPATWGFADDGGHIRIINNLGEEIDKVGYGDALDSEGEAVAVSFASGGSLERKAFASSSAETMAILGSDWTLGNSYDSGNNKNDFIYKNEREPQNSFSLTEPGEAPEIFPETIDDLEILSESIGTSSLILQWSAPKFASLNEESFYNIKMIKKEGELCNLEEVWEIASSAVDILLKPFSVGEEQIVEISELDPDTDYCFAIKTYNGKNWSQISNQAEAKTLINLVSQNYHIKLENFSHNESDVTVNDLELVHEIKEGENRILIAVVYMFSWSARPESVFFGSEKMIKASHSLNDGSGTEYHANGANNIIYYLKNPPIGREVIRVNLANGARTVIIIAALSFSDCDTNSLPPFSKAGMFSTLTSSLNIDSDIDNAFYIEALGSQLYGDSLEPASGQEKKFEIYLDEPRYTLYPFTSYLAFKELDYGLNELVWKRGYGITYSRNLIVLKPKID